ncbi:uncharacterized protein PRCAT00002926001 [Priceomyces carsonii]|uniref:uncharacterized protein n=1 Tax=Priceomyces carsonii TaxID=28549 RepID=UPI002ED98D59|nr:unnamed protein product [Priceomyces carsonii]
MYPDADIGNVTHKRRLSFIVIGAGLIGPRHANHIRQRPDCEIFAIVDHSSKGPSVAKEFNTLLFKNLDELFRYCELNNNMVFPDAAIIATPNATHVPLGLQLADKGIHLLVEKPLAPSASDCKTLIDFCSKKNVNLLVGHHRRFNPYIVATKENLHQVGNPIAIQGTWALSKNASYFTEKPWRTSVELGGGTLLINLIHDLDLLQYLLGPIEKVYAELLSKQRSIPGKSYDELVDEGAALTIRFASGCCGTFICSDNVTSPFLFESGTGENPTIPFNDTIAGFYRIFGTRGTLSVPDLNLYHQSNLQVEDRSWLQPISCNKIKMQHELMEDDSLQDDFGMLSPSPSPNFKDSPIYHISKGEKPKPFDLQLDHFINLINMSENVVKCPGEDALRALLCIEAVLKSIKTGSPQYVEEIENIYSNEELLKNL